LLTNFIARKEGGNKVMDWKLAAKVAGSGFGMVFIVLTILYLAIWLTKIVVAKIVIRKEKAKNNARINDVQ